MKCFIRFTSPEVTKTLKLKSHSTTFRELMKPKGDFVLELKVRGILDTEGLFYGSVNNRAREKQLTCLILPLLWQGGRNLKFCLHFFRKVHVETFKVSSEEKVKI